MRKTKAKTKATEQRKFIMDFISKKSHYNDREKTFKPSLFVFYPDSQSMEISYIDDRGNLKFFSDKGNTFEYVRSALYENELLFEDEYTSKFINNMVDGTDVKLYDEELRVNIANCTSEEELDYAIARLISKIDVICQRAKEQQAENEKKEEKYSLKDDDTFNDWRINYVSALEKKISKYETTTDEDDEDDEDEQEETVKEAPKMNPLSERFRKIHEEQMRRKAEQEKQEEEAEQKEPEKEEEKIGYLCNVVLEKYELNETVTSHIIKKYTKIDDEQVANSLTQKEFVLLESIDSNEAEKIIELMKKGKVHAKIVPIK